MRIVMLLWTRNNIRTVESPGKKDLIITNTFPVTKTKGCRDVDELLNQIVIH